MVLWLLGISGSGKSTLAEMLAEHYRQEGYSPYIIDGDIVRAFYDGDLGYSRKDREANIKRILLAAHVLDENQIFTIVANISPFEHLRQFAQQKIKGYNQIYLKKDLDISMKNDVKGVYHAHQGKTELVGVEVPFEEPHSSNLVIEVDKMTPEESCRLIVEYLDRKYGRSI